jgi:hypothetical protein
MLIAILRSKWLYYAPERRDAPVESVQKSKPDFAFLEPTLEISVLHAPRQTGKTSCLLALMDYLNQEGQYRALYVNVETGQSAREDVRRGMQAILAELASGAQYYLRDPFLQRTWRQTLEEVGEHAALNAVLTHKRLEETIAEGLAQTWEYADRCGASEAHLVIFDRDPAKPWDEKIFRREETYQGTRIAVWGM